MLFSVVSIAVWTARNKRGKSVVSINIWKQEKFFTLHSKTVSKLEPLGLFLTLRRKKKLLEPHSLTIWSNPARRNFNISNFSR